MIEYSVKLLSDAHIGSGLGGEMVNAYVSRDHRGRPVINASHIKGLVRQSLVDLLRPLVDGDAAVAALLGEGGYRPAVDDETKQGRGEGRESLCRFTDCTAKASKSREDLVRLITRTSVDDKTGVAADTSLRTTEAVRAGCDFTGRVRVMSNKLGDDLLRLGLLSVSAVGGSRNRGAGRCLIEVEDESRSPGQILREVVSKLKEGEQIIPDKAQSPGQIPSHFSGRAVWLQTEFCADTPVLCPDFPEASNVLRSGFSIPAGAVQGVILHRLNRLSPDLATRCFESSAFRAWPLQPMPRNNGGEFGHAVRVSLTHKVHKFLGLTRPRKASDQDQDTEWFLDEAVDDRDWKERPLNQPLKAADGVLLAGKSHSTMLWKAGDMARIFTTHGVHNDASREDGRNLFTVEAMAPGHWRGFLAIPEEIADLVVKLFEDDQQVAFGKGRSVRGSGELTLKRGELPAARKIKGEKSVTEGVYLITQSPVALDPAGRGREVRERFYELARKWAEQYGLGELTVEDVWAGSGIRFGWNRHRLADADQNGRTPALEVVLPGAVIRLTNTPDKSKLEKALLAGLGGSAARGFGALLPHPGVASDVWRERPELKKQKSSHERAIERAIKLDEGPISVPSASQVGAVMARLAQSEKSALEFLESVRKRGSAQYSKWQDVIHTFGTWIEAGPEEALISFEVLRNLIVAKDKEKRS